MCFVQTTVDGSLSGCDLSNSFDEETALYQQQEMKAVVSNPKISEFKTWVRFGRCVVLCFILAGIFFTFSNLSHEAIAVVVVLVVAFVTYDVFLQSKIAVILQHSARSDAIVSSLFPGDFHERLPVPDVSKENKQSLIKRFGRKSSTRTIFKEFTGDTEEFTSCADGLPSDDDNAPIADLYPETTIMLLDLVGFTAWSSAREPSAVFLLLESVFSTFDELAKRRRVFKVETVGDCYVAVAGLPDPRKDHALAMARFAKDCLRKFSVVTRKLECALGPDTSSLAVRIGLHSGAITGGVLRGERARFQLFGDTINTAARMESNGEPHQIHLSETTAELLRAAGKDHWLKKREDLVEAKGKGAMQCYWLDVNAPMAGTMEEIESIQDDDEDEDEVVAGDDSLSGDDLFLEERRLTRKQERLVDWNTTCLFQLCKQIHHNSNGERKEDTAFMQEVRKELRLFVYNIALKYNNNPFHNFEHASHVTMSVIKLLGRICDSNNFQSESEKHNKTFGIASDSLTQFAIVFAALIHDVDHSGVPNATLIDEQNPLADHYNGKSIAEHHSIAVAWDTLMRDEYACLRTAMSSSSSDSDDVDKSIALLRFQHVVESAVLATDIADSNVMADSESQWATKLGDEALLNEVQDSTESGRDEDINNDDRMPKEWHAMTLIACLVQASDVSHTMQHWHVYLRFTELLFKERFLAWKNGRAHSDPSVGWVESELGFFDYYVIPLAEKLNHAGVFGAAGIQYLDFARENRKELARKGEQLVREFRDQSEMDFMAIFLQNRNGIPEPSSLSFRVSEGSSSVLSNVSGSTAVDASVPPDFSFRISDQVGPGPGNLFLSKEWSLRDLSLGPRPPKSKRKLPMPYLKHFNEK